MTLLKNNNRQVCLFDKIFFRILITMTIITKIHEKHYEIMGISSVDGYQIGVRRLIVKVVDRISLNISCVSSAYVML